MRSPLVSPWLPALLAGLLLAGAPALAAAPADGSAAVAPRDGVVAWYFHTRFRCSTCRHIESLSREAIEHGFPDELHSGRLAFRVVDVEAPGNEHFARDFRLVTRSLVLVEYRDGKVVRWKNLPKIWQLVRDREAFIRYVRGEVRGFLDAGHEGAGEDR